MSVFKRMSDVVQQKLNAVLDRTEDPNQALDFAYQKQLESLQQVRRSVADVLTSEKRLELQQAQLKQSVDKLNAQAQQSLPLSSPATKDLELPINILGERVAFQVSTNQSGAWFRLQKFTPSLRIDPWSPVRGLN